ncbi:MAG: DUF3343 domain-containing protein [Ruminococcaceae bacterium]|nr:DUF3343 domain-containing protein [Oscillospiraceae bacterium]
MKNEWLITFRSVTYAQRGERILQRGKIPCRLQRTPKHLTERGCGYCLQIRGLDAPEAVMALRRERLDYGKLYALKEDGSTEERVL